MKDKQKGKQEDRLIGTRQASEILGFTQDHMRLLLRTGKIKGVKIGKVWRIPESEIKRIAQGVQNWIDWHEREAE
jgi:excisionase family DNA binding protein